MGFRIFCFFPNFSSVNLCRMTVPGEFLSAVIGEKTIPIFLVCALWLSRSALPGVDPE